VRLPREIGLISIDCLTIETNLLLRIVYVSILVVDIYIYIYIYECTKDYFKESISTTEINVNESNVSRFLRLRFT